MGTGTKSVTHAGMGMGTGMFSNRGKFRRYSQGFSCGFFHSKVVSCGFCSLRKFRRNLYQTKIISKLIYKIETATNPSFSVEPKLHLRFNLRSFRFSFRFVLRLRPSSFKLQIHSQIRSPKIRQPSASIFKIQSNRVMRPLRYRKIFIFLFKLWL
ncbi:hypothetical protein QL285_079302 [Trifolium repens]|nr:hypothetical protein QL285_079302 [Trifolium repens]